jgi:hypothetical protein
LGAIPVPPVGDREGVGEDLGFLTFLKACTVVFPSKALVNADTDLLTTWAFSLQTSAGVRMNQGTSSLTD